MSGTKIQKKKKKKRNEKKQEKQENEVYFLKLYSDTHTHTPPPAHTEHTLPHPHLPHTPHLTTSF